MSDVGELAVLASKCNHLESWTLVMTWLDKCGAAPEVVVSVLTRSGYNTAKRMTVCSTMQEEHARSWHVWHWAIT